MLKVESDYLNIRYVASIFFCFFVFVNQPVLTISAECLEGQFGNQGHMYSSVGLCNQVYNMGKKLESDLKRMFT